MTNINMYWQILEYVAEGVQNNPPKLDIIV